MSTPPPKARRIFPDARFTGMWNRAADCIGELMNGLPEKSLSVGGEGLVASSMHAEKFFAKITATDGGTPPKYSWTMAQDSGNGVFSDLYLGDTPPTGTAASRWAYELSGNPGVPVDGTAVVELYPAPAGEYFLFDWPGSAGPVYHTGITIVTPGSTSPTALDPGSGYLVVLRPTAHINVYGIQAPATTNRFILLYNDSAFNVALWANSALALAANRISMLAPWVVMGPRETLGLWYRDTFWRPENQVCYCEEKKQDIRKTRDCVKLANAPKVFLLTASGHLNGDCLECDVLNGEFKLLYDSGCTWLGPFMSYCGSIDVVYRLQWSGTTYWWITVSPPAAALGDGEVRYRLADTDFNPQGDNVFTLDPTHTPATTCDYATQVTLTPVDERFPEQIPFGGTGADNEEDARLNMQIPAMAAALNTWGF